MKKTIIIFLFCYRVFEGSAKGQFIFSGKIAPGTNTSVAIMYFNTQGKRVIEKADVQNGTYTLKGNIPCPEMVFFEAYKGNFKLKDDDDPNGKTFFLEPGTITATTVSYGHLKNLKISGSKTQDENESLKKTLASLGQRKEEAATRQYIFAHPNSYISAFKLTFYLESWPLATVEAIFSKFSSAIKNSIYGIEIQEKISAADASAVNKKATDFNAVDINGSLLKLSDFKGRYVLLDFWASWCVPCRESTPHLKHLFDKYHKAGLDIIAIADDDHNPAEWKKAVKKDKIDLWHNVLDGLLTLGYDYDSSKSIGAKYTIAFLPTKVLIDKNGVIIGRFEGEKAAVLDKKLAEIFESKN